jgi:hypothetical protein
MALFSSDKPAEAPMVVTESVPEETWYWAALVSILISLALKLAGRDHLSLFVGQWPPTFLLFGLYRRLSNK